MLTLALCIRLTAESRPLGSFRRDLDYLPVECFQFLVESQFQERESVGVRGMLRQTRVCRHADIIRSIDTRESMASVF